MDELLARLPGMLSVIAWPFVRVLAALSCAPIFGEHTLPMRGRVLVALALSVVLQAGLPTVPEVPVFSVRGLVVLAEQILVGAMLGMVFHLVLTILLVLGSLMASQMGLSMAMMNDPINGTSSDAISALLNVLFVLIFFACDGHLLLTEVLARSFHVWPIGSGGVDAAGMRALVYGVGWSFAVALMLSLPVVFTILVVQAGLGFLNRVAPTFNLFSLGFSITTLFGLLLLVTMTPALPGHLQRAFTHVLDLLARMGNSGVAA